MGYLVLKALHVLGAVLFLGNVVIGVFWKVHGDRKGTLAAREQALSGIVAADRIFTVPPVFLLVITGTWMAVDASIPVTRTLWISAGIWLFAITGVLFVAVVGPVQKRLLANVRAGLAGSWDEAGYRALSRRWNLWGGIATLLPLVTLFFMVLKPA